MQVTSAELQKLAPKCPNLAAWIEPLNAAMAEFAITAEPRIEMFLAQALEESGGLRAVVENLNYSAQGLANTWDRYSATGKRGGPPNALALRLSRNPQAIANNVYANRNGNGNEVSGDGWSYRGRGLFQLTGKGNYIAAKTALNIDCVTHPELLETPANAARSAAWFWKAHGLNELADKGDFNGTTKVVNGGDIGGRERIGLWTLTREVIA